MSITKVTDAGVDTNRIITPIIINGDMQISQRATSVTSHNDVSYTTVDRFKTVCETGTYTVIQESLTSGNAYLNGFKKALRLDTTTAEASAGSAGEQTTIEQRIEGQNLQQFLKGTANAKPFTLAFWVKASKTGSNLQVNLRDVDNTRQVGGTYDIDAADTWEKKVINFPADTTGAFDNDNANSLTIEWFLDGGSNYSGGSVPTAWEASANADRNVTNFDLAGSTDNDWALTGVQLEVGTFDTNTIPSFPFEDHSTSLLRCQRYFNQMKQNGSDSNIRYCSGICTSSTATEMAYVVFPELRSTPTLVLPAANKFRVRSASAVTCSSISADNRHKNGVNIQASVSSGLSSGDGCNFDSNASDSLIQLDAEL
tara:strand:+ start:69 stop:1178 length:1110 start_codon:yes stop_codon:yes gene_type:complete